MFFVNLYFNILLPILGISTLIWGLILIKRASKRVSAAQGDGMHRLPIFARQAVWAWLEQGLPFAIVVTDQQRRITHCNATFLSVFAYTESELIGKSTAIYYASEEEFFRQGVERYNPESAVALDPYEIAYKRKSGEVFTAEVIGSPVYDETGAVIAYIGLIRDVNEKKQVKAELLRHKEEQQTILDSVPALITFKDKQNRILRVNKRAAEHIGLPPSEIEGRSVYDLLPWQAEVFYEEDLEVMRDGQPKCGMVQEVTSRFGEKRWMRTDKIPYRNPCGEIIGVIVFSVDITPLKKAEKMLVSANRAKSEFLAIISHELRTPLNAITGFSSCLLKGVHGSLNERQEVSMNVVSRASLNLLALIDNILDITKIESGTVKLHSEVFDIVELAKSSVETTGTMAGNKTLNLKFSSEYPSLNVYADKTKLNQIILNLLTNAIKFTDEGYVEMNITTKGDDLLITVSDTGIGMSENEMIGIFDMFSQVDSSCKRSYGGAGLGLAISKKLSELHGGTISVSSKKNIGSTFICTLPIRCKFSTESASSRA